MEVVNIWENIANVKFYAWNREEDFEWMSVGTYGKMPICLSVLCSRILLCFHISSV